MTLNKAQKLVRMVDLMTRRGGIRASDLMERFDLEPRSLRRYMSDLRGLDLPIEDEGRSDDRIIAIDPRWRRTGVRLTLAEVLSLHFGRRLFTFLEGTSFADDLQGAIERLQPAISRAHAELSRHLDTKFIAVAEHAKDYRGAGAELVDDVVTALVYNHPLDARYRKVDGSEKRYVLHPYTLGIYRQGLYIFALDVDSSRVKTFAVERFTELDRRRSEHFTPPASWSPEAYLEHAFGIMSGRPEHVRVAFVPGVAAYIRERTWHPSQSFRVRQDGWLELSMRVALTVELVSWVRSFGEDARVVGPAPLQEQVAKSLAAAAALYKPVSS